jgi:very-short-patch-repair endonuclease
VEGSAYEQDARAEDLTLLLRVWPDIEEVLLQGDSSAHAELAEALRHAFRVEVQEVETYDMPSFRYAIYFDVESDVARRSAAVVQDRGVSIEVLLGRHAPVQGDRARTVVLVVPRARPVAGEVCPRVIVPAPQTPDLRDLPQRIPDSPLTDYVEVDGYFLTPIEAAFYDPLKQADLTFAVQPWVQMGTTKYRPDFIVFYGGRSVVVELDGHEGHKTKDQRNYDSKRERWFKARGMSTVRWTGSQVFANASGCVRELMEILRGQRARP